MSGHCHFGQAPSARRQPTARSSVRTGHARHFRRCCQFVTQGSGRRAAGRARAGPAIYYHPGVPFFCLTGTIRIQIPVGFRYGSVGVRELVRIHGVGGSGAGRFQFQSYVPRLSECRPRAERAGACDCAGAAASRRGRWRTRLAVDWCCRLHVKCRRHNKISGPLSESGR